MYLVNIKVKFIGIVAEFQLWRTHGFSIKALRRQFPYLKTVFLNKYIFWKWAIPGLLFLFIFVFSIHLIVNKWIKFCRWPDSNCKPLVLEATAPPTEPQSMLFKQIFSPPPFRDHRWWPLSREENFKNSFQRFVSSATAAAADAGQCDQI